MKKLILPLAVLILLAMVLAAPARAQPAAEAAPAPMPAGTASPRDWSKKTEADGTLKKDAVNADSAILIDAKSGKVLFDKHSGAKEYPASTTKIMTCLLALENCGDLSKLVTIGTLPAADYAVHVSSAHLIKGETMSMEDLLYGLMLPSGNDAADAIAIDIAGSISDFVAMMNQKAQALGMTNTHYDDTNGLANDTNHYTTAKDMATLAQAAMKYPEFVKIVSTYTFTMPPTNKVSKSQTWVNTNHLLSRDQYGYQYATGIKTGNTDIAESTFVSSAQKDSMSLISVIMHEKNRDDMWVDSVTMFEYGFNFYSTVNLNSMLSSQTVSTDIQNAAGTDPGQGKLSLVLKPLSQAYLTDRKDVIANLTSDASQFQQQVNITKDTAPIKKDDKVGTVTFYYEGNPVLVCDLLAARAVEAMAAPASSVAAASSATASDPLKSSQTKSGGTSSAIVWLAVAALLAALGFLTVRFKYRQSNSAKMRR